MIAASGAGKQKSSPKMEDRRMNHLFRRARIDQATDTARALRMNSTLKDCTPVQAILTKLGLASFSPKVCVLMT
jgi:hypothetical protein